MKKRSMSEGDIRMGSKQVEDIKKSNPYECTTKPTKTNIKYAEPSVVSKGSKSTRR
jgi:hypothetical protein